MASQGTSEPKWTDVIKSVQSPLGFFVFVGLVAQGVLLALAARGTEYQGTIVIVGLLFFFAVVVGAVIVAAFHPRGSEILSGQKAKQLDVLRPLADKLSDNDLRILVELGGYSSATFESVVKRFEKDLKAGPAQRLRKYKDLGLVTLGYHDQYLLSTEGRALAELLKRSRERG